MLNQKLDRVIDTMATKVDIAKLDKRVDVIADTMATKVDIARLDERIDTVVDTMATSDNVAKLSARFDELERKSEERFQQVMSSIDALTKAVTDTRHEYSIVAIQMRRYDEWFRILAKKAKVKLPV